MDHLLPLSTGTNALTLAYLTGLLVAVLVTDLRIERIPDHLWIATSVAGLLRAAVLATPPWAVTGSAVVGLVPAAARLVTRGGLGWGDAKLGMALSLLLGPSAAAAALLVASLLALGGLGVSSLRNGRAPYEAGLPFGPYLVAGAIVSLILEASHAA